MLFLFSSVNRELPISTVVSAALLLLFCVPMCIVLYRFNTHKIAKTIFLGLSLTLTGFFVSGIIWYVLPASINWNFLVPLRNVNNGSMLCSINSCFIISIY